MNTKINVPLLLKVADQIFKHPEQFEMAVWDCETTACIAGWMQRLSGKHRYELTKEWTGFQYNDLFFESEWPRQFQFLGSDTAADRAAKAVKRIHAFLDEHAPGWRDEPTHFPAQNPTHNTNSTIAPVLI